MSDFLSTLSRQDVTSGVYASLRRPIITGQLQPGAELRLEQLAQRLGVSRTPVREALRRLEAEGLVQFRPHRSVIVALISVAEVEESYCLRILVESFLTRLAVGQLDAEALTGLASSLRAMEQCLHAGDADGLEEHHRAFHRSIYRRASAELLYQLAVDYSDRTERYRRMYNLVSPPARWRAHAQHVTILDACSEGRTELAAGRMAHHLATTALGLITHIAPDYRPLKLEQTCLVVAPGP